MERAEFMHKRREQATALLCNPDTSSDSPSFPFDEQDYPYIDAIDDNVSVNTRKRWRTVNAADLVHENPFKDSEYVPGWPCVWDACIGIPAVKMRGNTVYLQKNLPVVRTINDTWQNKTMIDLSRIGRMTPTSEYVRPKGAWLLDYMTDDDGWKLLELAHMLAHRAEDPEVIARRTKPYTYGQNGSLFQLFVFKVFMCRKFGLPIDVDMSCEDAETQDMFDKYGIVASVNTKLRDPVLKIPASGQGCLVPGKDICVVSGSVHIEPTPHSAAVGTDRWLEMNRWSCEPTIVAFAGWELVDVVTHAPLVSAVPGGRPYYALQPCALQCSDSFCHFIASAEEVRGKCIPDSKRYWLVDEYIKSEEFSKALMESPPIPCKRCFQLNMMSDGSPMKPKSEKPDKKAKKGELPTAAQIEWNEWNDKIEKIFGTCEKAARFMDLREHGALAATRNRRSRTRTYNRKVNNLKRARYLAGRVEKLKKGGYLQKAEELEEVVKTLIEAANAKRNV